MMMKKTLTARAAAEEMGVRGTASQMLMRSEGSARICLPGGNFQVAMGVFCVLTKETVQPSPTRSLSGAP